jgi:hypothetical protein
MTELAFPATEAWKHSIERLRASMKASKGEFAGKFGALFRGVCALAASDTYSSSTVESQLKSEIKAIVSVGAAADVPSAKLFVALSQFIIDQLVYFVAAPAQITAEVLSPADPAGIPSEIVNEIQTAWSELGKAVVGAARKRCTTLYCGPAGGQFLVATPYLQQHAGAVTEVDAGEGNVDIEIRTAKPTHTALVAIRLPPPVGSQTVSNAPADGQPTGPVLHLNTKQIYDLFCEVDSIQRQLDQLANQ